MRYVSVEEVLDIKNLGATLTSNIQAKDKIGTQKVVIRNTFLHLAKRLWKWFTSSFYTWANKSEK